MKQNNKVIGILGGMGPQASARLVSLLVELSSSDFGAKDGVDFPEIILDSVPAPDFISNGRNKKFVIKILQNRIKNLERMHVSTFAIACNTAHLILNDLQSSINTPFISMVNEVVADVENKDLRKVGLLATPVTIKSNLFQKALGNKGIKVVLSSQRQMVDIDRVIRRVIAGENTLEDKKILIRTASSLQGKGAQGIILGCTELPLIFPKKFSIPVFDSLEILAKALLIQSFKKVN